MTNSDELPFEWSVNSLNSWLDSLIPLHPLNAANQFNQLIKQLKQTQRSTKVLELLPHLIPCALHLARTLKKLALSDKKTASEIETFKIAKLATQLLRNLSLIFCRYAESDRLTPEQQLMTCFYALQLGGYQLEINAALHEPPSATLWQKTSALYLLSKQRELLTQKITAKQPEFKTQTTIEAVVKRNILFTIAMPYRYSAAEIALLFAWCEQYAEQLVIKSEPFMVSPFVWDLNGDGEIPCQTKYFNEQSRYQMLAIDIHLLVPILNDNTSNLPAALQQQLALHWSGYASIIGAALSTVARKVEVLVGFEAICDFLDKRQKLAKLLELSGDDQKPKTGRIHDRAFELVENDAAKFGLLTQAKQINSATSQSAKLLETSHKSFVVAKIEINSYQTGDLALIVYNDQSIVLAAIRQQTLLGTSKVPHLLLEILGKTPFLHQAVNSTAEHNKALLLLNTTAQVDALLPETVNIGTQISGKNNQTLCLQALHEYSPFFACFKARLDS